tara:strand:- start:567 stop:731 length:165 start_codon:yes stop_codon:yes gene_type:complete
MDRGSSIFGVFGGFLILELPDRWGLWGWGIFPCPEEIRVQLAEENPVNSKYPCA